MSPSSNRGSRQGRRKAGAPPSTYAEQRTQQPLGGQKGPGPRNRSIVERYRGWILAGVAVAVIVAAIVIVAIKFGPSNTSKEQAAGAATPAPAVVSGLTGIPQSVYDAVGAGTAGNGPKAIPGSALSSDGKPVVLYMGAEYCPFCAAERWAMIAALSRFGAFSNLHTTRSSASDVFPNTPTFTFYGSSYTSQYVSFQSVELQTNQPNGSGGYTTLQSPTSEQQALLTQYDRPPYSSSTGGIPFVDFGGKYVLSGATYDPQLLAGKDWSQIVSALSDPSNALTKAIAGSANMLTAAICTTTGNQPAAVCTSPGVQSAAGMLGK